VLQLQGGAGGHTGRARTHRNRREAYTECSQILSMLSRFPWTFTAMAVGDTVHNPGQVLRSHPALHGTTCCCCCGSCVLQGPPHCACCAASQTSCAVPNLLPCLALSNSPSSPALPRCPAPHLCTAAAHCPCTCQTAEGLCGSPPPPVHSTAARHSMTRRSAIFSEFRKQHELP
jgi:hypothetical protein